MRSSHKLLGAVGIVSLLATGGSAFTAALTPPGASKDFEVGYVTQSLAGGVITSIHYTLTLDGTVITGVTVVLTGDTSNRVLAVGFTNSGTSTSLVDCAAGSYSNPSTTYVCDVTATNPAGHTIVAGDRTTATVDHVNVALH